MLSRISERIETAANISIIIVAALGGAILLRDHFLANRVKVESRAPSPQAGSKRETLVGKAVSLPDVDWAKNGQTLVVVLAKGCQFCTESASFYKQIASAAAQRQGFQVVAAFPQDVNEARAYLEQLEVPISEVRQISLNEIGVRGTPTLLLVDKAGVVKDAWLGRLKSDKEAEVLKEATCQGCG